MAYHSKFVYKGDHSAEFLSHLKGIAGGLTVEELVRGPSTEKVPLVVSIASDWSLRNGVDLEVTQTEYPSGKKAIGIIEVGSYPVDQPIGINYTGRDWVYSTFDSYVTRTARKEKALEDAPITKALLEHLADMWKQETGISLTVTEARSKDGTPILELTDEQHMKDVAERDRKLELLLDRMGVMSQFNPDWLRYN